MIAERWLRAVHTCFMTFKLHNNGRRRVAYEMTVTLDGVEPAVWRRVRVPADYTLDRLHDVIQIVMGWQDNHLHHFEIGKHRFTETANRIERRGLPRICG
jgi:hypothetical protein